MGAKAPRPQISGAWRGQFQAFARMVVVEPGVWPVVVVVPGL